MSNDKNLIPLNERSKEAQREIQSKGGKAAAVSSRRRKALKESMDMLLSMPISDKRKLLKAARMGFEGENADNSALVVIALFNKAISGDVAAIKELRSMVDEDKPGNDQLSEAQKLLVLMAPKMNSKEV